MSDQQQRTLWAVEKFRDFVKAWTPPAARNQILEPQRWKVNLDDDLRDGERGDDTPANPSCRNSKRCYLWRREAEVCLHLIRRHPPRLAAFCFPLRATGSQVG